VNPKLPDNRRGVMALFQARRTTRIWIILALAGVVVLLLVGWLVYGAGSFAGRIAAIRAAGDPASLAELAPKPVPPDEDAAAILASVAERIDSFGKDHGRFYKSPIGKTYDQRNDGDPLTAEQAAAIKSILVKYQDLDAAVGKATACPRYASKLDFSNWSQFQTAHLEPLQNIRTVARFLSWQSELAMSEGRTSDAVETGIEQLRLAKLFESEPLLISWQVTCALRGGAASSLYGSLASGKISESLHDELDAELARQDDMLGLVRAIKEERAYSITALDEQLGRVGRVVINTIGWRVKSMHNGVLDWYDQALPVIGKPWYELQADPVARGVFKTPTGFGVLTDLLVPAVEAAYESANRTTAIMRSLRIYNDMR
jgi:hypothetical protein